MPVAGLTVVLDRFVAVAAAEEDWVLYWTWWRVEDRTVEVLDDEEADAVAAETSLDLASRVMCCVACMMARVKISGE